MRVEVTHADRVVFPEIGRTKGDVVDYYRAVARWMLPLIKDRPLSLQRFPTGVAGEGFVQQDIGHSDPPAWVGRVEVPRESGGTVVHAVANRAETLAWLANQGTLAIHMWPARVTDLRHPDLLVLDLDPSDGDPAPIRDTALDARDLLHQVGLRAFAQLTGSRGVHVVAPLADGPDFDTVRQFAKDVADRLVALDPRHRTSTFRKSDRGRRLYIDVMRNGYAQTIVAPYSIRALPTAPVATPVDWDELADASFRADRFTMDTVLDRLRASGDPWAGMRRTARSLAAARERLAGLRAA